MKKILRMIGSNSGLAQIPLVIGLLIMAIAIPVATKLSQQTQENRGSAAGQACRYCNDTTKTCATRQPPCVEEMNNCDSNSDCGGGSVIKPPAEDECSKNEVDCSGTIKWRDCDGGKWNNWKFCNSTSEVCVQDEGCVEKKDVPVATVAPTSSFSCSNYKFSESVCNAVSGCRYVDGDCKAYSGGKSCNTWANVPVTLKDGESVCVSSSSLQVCNNGSLVSQSCADGWRCTVGDKACKPVPTAIPTSGVGADCSWSLDADGKLKSGESVCRWTDTWSVMKCDNGKMVTVSSCGGSASQQSTHCADSVVGGLSTANCITPIPVKECQEKGTYGCYETSNNIYVCGNDYKRYQDEDCPTGTVCSVTQRGKLAECVTSKDCSWWGNLMKDGETKCFNGFGGVASQMVKCSNGDASEVGTYLTKDCRKLGVGEYCTWDGQCVTGTCNLAGIKKMCVDLTGKSGSLKKGGVACAANPECNSGKCTYGHCEKLNVGQDCLLDGQCATGSCTLLTGLKKVCVDPSGATGGLKPGGAACAANPECNSGECTFGHCEALKDGQKCSFASQCASNKCNPNTEDVYTCGGVSLFPGSCNHAGNIMTNGQTQCFTSPEVVGNALVQQVKCADGKTTTLKTCAGPGAKCNSDGSCSGGWGDVVDKIPLILQGLKCDLGREKFRFTCRELCRLSGLLTDWKCDVECNAAEAIACSGKPSVAPTLKPETCNSNSVVACADKKVGESCQGLLGAGVCAREGTRGVMGGCDCVAATTGWTGRYCMRDGAICSISVPPSCAATCGIDKICKGSFGKAECVDKTGTICESKMVDPGTCGDGVICKKTEKVQTWTKSDCSSYMKCVSDASCSATSTPVSTKFCERHPDTWTPITPVKDGGKYCTGGKYVYTCKNGSWTRDDCLAGMVCKQGTTTCVKAPIPTSGKCECIDGKRIGDGCTSFEYDKSCGTVTLKPTTAPAAGWKCWCTSECGSINENSVDLKCYWTSGSPPVWYRNECSNQCTAAGLVKPTGAPTGAAPTPLGSFYYCNAQKFQCTRDSGEAGVNIRIGVFNSLDNCKSKCSQYRITPTPILTPVVGCGPNAECKKSGACSAGMRTEQRCGSIIDEVCCIKPLPTGAPAYDPGCYCFQGNPDNGDCIWSNYRPGTFFMKVSESYCRVAPAPTGFLTPGVTQPVPTSGARPTAKLTAVPTSGGGGGRPTAMPTSGGGGGGRCNEKCPTSDGRILQNCTPPDSDGSSQDSICDRRGRIEPCGGKQYCCDGSKWSTSMAACGTAGKCKQCPTDFKCYTNGSEYRWFVTGYVMEGFELVPADTTNCGGVTKPNYMGKQKGDATCDGFVDGYDYSVWRKEYVDISQGEPVVRDNWEADFTGNDGACDGIVDGYDYSLWRKQYKDLNGGGN